MAGGGPGARWSTSSKFARGTKDAHYGALDTGRRGRAQAVMRRRGQEGPGQPLANRPPGTGAFPGGKRVTCARSVCRCTLAFF